MLIGLLLGALASCSIPSCRGAAGVIAIAVLDYRKAPINELSKMTSGEDPTITIKSKHEANTLTLTFVTSNWQK